MEPKIIVKDVSRAKLTISPDRFEIKIPSSWEISEYSDSVISFLKAVVAKIEAKQTLRGAVVRDLDGVTHSIQLFTDNKKFFSKHSGTIKDGVVAITPTLHEVVKEEAAKFGVEVNNEADVEYVIWEHTGFPGFWSITEENPTPEACFRSQIREWAKGVQERRALKADE